MTIRNHKNVFGVVIVLAVATLASGCATKNFVKARVDPLDQRLGTVEKTSEQHGQSVEELDRRISLTDERVLTADQKATAAAGAAEKAQQDALRADGKAENAGQSAKEALDGIGKLASRVDGLQNYELVSRETILFDFESSALTAQAKETLDATAQQLEVDAPYVIEVQGFTDKTGSSSYNLALSDRRARTVARYLTSELNVPLHRIHMIGQGSDKPVADNSSRTGRQQNRRVELRLFVAGQPPLSAEARPEID